jgi:hypothetical protein
VDGTVDSVEPMAAPLTVPPRFRGPASSGNGGWTAGALAAYLAPGPVQVTLRTPPPLAVPLTVDLGEDEGSGEETAVATNGEVVVAEAEPAQADVTPVPPVGVEAARAAEATYAGLRFHPFPSCFACGTGRAEGDGLRIFPGRVTDDDEGRVRVAATWAPDPSLGGDRATLPVTWAALDCVGGWAGDLEQRLMVLGRMTAHVRDLPRVGDEHLVVGTARGASGRRTFTAATLYSPDGRVLGSAEHVWVAVDPEDFS